VKASVSPCVKTPQPLGQNSTRVVESRRRLMTEIYNKVESTNNRTKRVAAACAAGKLTPDNFSAKAKAANADRLTAQQLEAFCDYWTERNARGHCRFESEKFFELPRRIATWARRERVAPIPSAAPAAVKPERPIWKDCARRCRYWDAEKRWCSKFVRTEPKSCEHCREF